jgi:hypothetical protein
MIFEYALEPATVASWKGLSEYRFFAGEFGLGSPRAMAAYPRFSLWRRAVIAAAKAAGADDMDFQRITALLGLLQSNKVERGSSPFDGSRPWLENAEAEHVRPNSSFKAIMAVENPRSMDVVILGTIADAVVHPLWPCTRNENRDRKAGPMSDCVENMLRLARTIAFIDPCFHPGSPRYRSTLRAFLDVTFRNRTNPPARIEIHTSFSKAPGAEYVDVFNREIPPLIPIDATVRLRRLTQKGGGEKLHDRFILTNLGGVTFTVGLDEGNQGETTAIHLLDPDEYKLRWGQYMGNPPAFDCPEAPTDVLGTRHL